mmetsp:Transcript_38125/g.83329  ORF Transcript_38125/g.83329 Transcript_38125/m.83329 type:complete len:207 (-) Transcript_38125:119-739(-)
MLLGDLRSAHFRHVVRHQQRDKVLLCGCAESGADVHVRRQVGGVDLELAADSALNGPPHVKSTAQSDSEIRDPHDQSGVLPIVSQRRGFVDGRDDLDKRHEGEIGEASTVAGVGVNQSPHQQESLSDILVRRPGILIHDAVNYFRDLIDKHHHLVLQDLGGIGKILNVAVAKDAVDHAPRDHSVDTRSVVTLHILPNNLCTGLSKS